MRRAVWAVVLCGFGLAQPAAVLDLLRQAAEALADKDADAFLAHFDRSMPRYRELQDAVQDLLAVEDVASTIEVIRDEGTEQVRELELDRVLRIGRNEPRRAAVKCRVERQGRSWRIVRLEPVEFFRRN